MAARQATFTSAFRAALKAVTIQPADAAAVLLAQRYAAQLDDDGDLTKLGPQLLRALTELAMTPLSRATVMGRGGDAVLSKGGEQQRAPAATPLDQLRERRQQRARQNRASAVDTATP